MYLFTTCYQIIWKFFKYFKITHILRYQIVCNLGTFIRKAAEKRNQGANLSIPVFVLWPKNIYITIVRYILRFVWEEACTLVLYDLLTYLLHGAESFLRS